jgi:serine/threonine-protein kinase
MPLEPGQMLSHYRLVEKIGEGGMGVVWKALDTTLSREVAVKLLPEDIARSPERTGRFEREARLLAHLNHPHIATIHGFDRSGEHPFLVLELVPGEPLDAMLQRGPLPVPEALGLCLQVAEGLESAHEKGVIHRDLKPANIKLTETGAAKILDFGLAKAMQPETELDPSRSPTVTTGGTRAGTIFGTAAYMSPEQARGRPLDRRTDIWAFGCVLFECLTGRTAFGAETVSDVMVRILEREPDWGLLPASTPPAVRALLERCLRKDARQRLRDIGEARIILGEHLASADTASLAHGAGPVSASAARTAGPAGGMLRLLAALALGLLLGGAAAWTLRPEPGAPAPTSSLHASLALGAGATIRNDTAPAVDISGDGRRVAFVAVDPEGRRSLHVRDLATGQDRVIADEGGIYGPFFSPDGRWVGYFQSEGSSLMKAPVDGGAPVRICDTPVSSRGAAWGPDDRIIFAPSYNQSLHAVAAGGGTPDPLTALREGEKTHRLPEILPGGRTVLFVIGTGTLETWDDAEIAALDVDSGTITTVVKGGSRPHWSPTGHVLYARAGALHAVRFDPESGRVGVPFEVLPGAATDPVQGPSHFALSGSGTLVYAPGGVLSGHNAVLAVDRQGREERLELPPFAYFRVNTAPDGSRLVLQVEQASSSLWVHDLSRQTLSRIDTDWESELSVWSHDSRFIYFSQTRGESYGIYRIAADGSGRQELVLETPSPAAPDDVSPDGRFLVFSLISPENGMDAWVAPLDDPSGVRPILDGRANETQSVLSPDGRWLAFSSNQSGRYEVYVTPFPDGGPRWPVSRDGGEQTLWSRDGRQILYRSGDRIMAADVVPGDPPSFGTPRALFDAASYLDPMPQIRSGDLLPDGRMLMFRGEDPELPARLDLILQFPALLRSREPGS